MINRIGQANVGLFSACSNFQIRNVSLVNIAVFGAGTMGSLIGSATSGNLTEIKISGNITGTTHSKYVGGIVGSFTNSNISNSLFNGRINLSERFTGGLIGRYLNGTIINCSFTGIVLGISDNTGGLMGYTWGVNGENLWANGIVMGEVYSGMIVGRSNGDQFINVMGNGTVSGSLSVGGLFGDLVGNVTNASANGKVLGDARCGGLVGRHSSGTISNSYSTCNVNFTYNTTTSAGAFAGINYARIINCYSIGSVHREYGSAITECGFVGEIGEGEGCEMRGNFWDLETSGQTSSAGNATGKTTAQMRHLMTYTEAEWDIVDVTESDLDTAHAWNMIDGISYPFLSWCPAIQMKIESPNLNQEFSRTPPTFRVRIVSAFLISTI